MKILALDASTKKIVVSIKNGETIVHASRVGVEKHAIALAPFIDSIFKTVGIGISDIDLLGLGVGPGNLTGLRIGISWAMGVCSVVGVKIVPLNSLELISKNVVHERKVVVRKARKGFVYAQIFPDWKEPKVLDVRSMEEELFNLEDYILLGDGAELFDGKKAPEEFWYPIPEILMKLTLERAESAVDYTEVEPMYIQKSIAELNYERRARGGV